METKDSKIYEAYESLDNDSSKEYMQDYLAVKKQANEDRKKIDFEGKNANVKYQIAFNRVNELNYKNNWSKNFYIANLLVFDDEEFLKIYEECGNDQALCAEKLGVLVGVVKSKMLGIKSFGVFKEEELNKVDDVVSEEKAEETNDSVEEKIDELDQEDIIVPKNLEAQKIDTSHQEEEYSISSVEENTIASIAKINRLFNENESKDEMINKQSGIIDNLNEKIVLLEEENKDKKKIIEEKDKEIEALNQKLEALIKENKDLTTFYQRVMSSLENDKKTR